MTLDRAFFRYAVYAPVTWARGERYSHYLKQFEQSQWTDPNRLRELQERKLNALVDWACARVPLYRERIDRTQLPKRLALDDLPRLPTLSKTDVRDRAPELRAPCGERVTLKTTGGSTGQPVTIAKSRTATAQELAAMWRGWGWAGVDVGDRQARFWGVPLTSLGRWRAKLIDVVSHRRRFSAFSLSEADMAAYTAALNRFQPDYVYGYVSILREYASYLTTNGSAAFRPKVVFATSEVLTAQDRRAIAAGFGCPVFEEYGCGELGNLAHECDRGSLHLSAENLIVEILPKSLGSDSGDVVVTELNNLAMPLLRYRLGDVATSRADDCPCGRTLPRIAGVAGRAYDIVYNREGRMFHGEFFMYILEEAKQRSLGIQAFQVVQHDFERFTIRVQAGTGYGPEAEALVRDRIRQGYGAYAHVSFEPVPGIHREPSGKMRLIVGCGPAPGPAPASPTTALA
jgi:phenylacetate-CoA ligase